MPKTFRVFPCPWWWPSPAFFEPEQHSTRHKQLDLALGSPPTRAPTIFLSVTIYRTRTCLATSPTLDPLHHIDHWNARRPSLHKTASRSCQTDSPDCEIISQSDRQIGVSDSIRNHLVTTDESTTTLLPFSPLFNHRKRTLVFWCVPFHFFIQNYDLNHVCLAFLFNSLTNHFPDFFAPVCFHVVHFLLEWLGQRYRCSAKSFFSSWRTDNIRNITESYSRMWRPQGYGVFWPKALLFLWIGIPVGGSNSIHSIPFLSFFWLCR